MHQDPDTLARNPNFRKLWAGQIVSLVGSAITPLALTLLAVGILEASPAEVAILQAMQYVPAVLMGLFAGVWVDRLRRRPLLIGADIGCAAALLAVPLCAALGVLRIEVLYLVAFLLGSLGVVFGVAYTAFLPSLVGGVHLVEANSRLEGSRAVARIAWPGLGGALVQALGAQLAVALDAASYLLLALAVGLIRASESPPRRAASRHLGREIGAGLRAVGGNPALRALLLSSATLDIGWNALFAVYVLFAIRTLGLSPGVVGLIFGLGSAGALLGSLVARRLADRAGIGRTLIGTQCVVGAGGLLIALAVALPHAALPLLLAVEVVQSAANTIFGITRASLTQALVPDSLRGRVNASERVIGLAVAVLGTAIGGVLGERLGVPPTIVLGTMTGLPAFLWLLARPIRSVRRLATADLVATAQHGG